MLKIFLSYLAGVNIAAFILYGADKRRAVRQQWRISEATLLLFAWFGGGVGALAGMLVFHHKTRKWKFRILVPLSLIVWAGALTFAFLKTGFAL